MEGDERNEAPHAGRRFLCRVKTPVVVGDMIPIILDTHTLTHTHTHTHDLFDTAASESGRWRAFSIRGGSTTALFSFPLCPCSFSFLLFLSVSSINVRMSAPESVVCRPRWR